MGNVTASSRRHGERWSPEKLARKNRWKCAQCGDVLIYRPSPDGLCTHCEKAAEEDRLRKLPKELALKRSGIPPRLRQDFPWLASGWPRDPRPGAAKIDPLAWPALVVDPGSDSPVLVTLAGSNGAGKSTRGAHLLYLLFRQGIRPLAWVNEADLAEEWSDFGPRSLYTKALKAGASVLDDLGSKRGRHCDPELAFDVDFQLIDKRMNLGRPTIITTHRPVSKKGAAKRGQPESEAIQSISPAIYDRMRSGLILELPSRSHRVDWAKAG